MSERVEKIFSEVHENYDMVNSISSLGTIILWRKKGAEEAITEANKYKLLDIATGTGELAFEIKKAAESKGKEIEITAMDQSRSMLKMAKKKAKERSINIKFEEGDAMSLKYKSDSFDVVTSAFALRNVDDLYKFASEARRILKKGGRFVFMDMARPDSGFDRAFIKAYWLALSGIGAMENKDAYEWLVTSVNKFDKAKFISILKETKFKNIKKYNLFSGAAFLVTGNK